MKRVFKSLFMIILILCITVFIPTFMDSIKADEADYSDNDIPGSGTGGTTVTDSTLLVLEIVPYVGMGEIGYLVGGQEPFDEELFNKDSAAGKVSFLGGAITAYDNYTVKDLPASGNQDKGWIPIKTYASQNGYFQYVGNNNGYYQKSVGQTVYTRVADGTGNYRAKLDTESTQIYTETWNQTNYKNVNAYFVCGTTTGATLYNTTNTYTPVSVTRITNHTGDYDYNSDTATFTLNKGKGEYDVLFARSVGGSKSYYMTSDYQIVDDCSGEYSWTLTYEPATGGNYVMSTTGMVFTYNQYERGNCAYNWVVDSGATSRASFTQEGETGTSSERIWVQGQKVVTWKEYNFNVTMVNNEWFKRFSLGLTSDQCKESDVKVVTLTPAQLNTPTYQHYLKEADMFYINDKYTHNTAYIDLYENFSYAGLALSTAEKLDSLKKNNKLNFGFNDLSWASTMLVYNRITGVKSDGSLGGYRASVVFDNTYYQDAVGGNGDYAAYHENVTVSFTYNGSGATVCNLAKLYIMVYQRDPVDFYNLFLSSTAPFHITAQTSSRNSTGTTGSFVRPDSTASPTSIEATFWNSNTFCPYCFDANGNVITPIHWTDEGKAILNQEIPNFNITAQTTDMIASVLTLNGMDIFTAKFIEPIYGMPADAVAAAKFYLESMGITPGSNLNLFSYILVTSDSGTGYGNGKEETNDSDKDGTGGSNYRSYYCVLNIEPTADFTASEANIKKILDGYNIKIINMTSMEFNSNILDINTHYDMIYIGCGSGRFNLNGTATAFNTDALNQSVYNKGDSIVTSTGTKTYTGNDITVQKKNELNDFLKAGYPVITESGIYTLSNALQSSTNLYSFIQTAKANTAYSQNLLNYADYTGIYSNFMKYLVKALNIDRPQIKMLRPTTVTGSPVNYLYVGADNKLYIEFAVMPNGNAPDRSIYYSAYLYLDYNEDGIFSESEQLNINPVDGASNIGFNESTTKSHLYTYNMTDYNGVYQWKVEVVRQTVNSSGGFVNTSIRSEITGYAAVSHRQTIKVLQITDNPSTDSTAYSLNNAAGISTSLLSTYIKIDNVPDYNIQFDTKSVADFEKLYEKEAYTAAPSTDKLSEYHLLIMDNQVDQISNTKGAVSNIKDEINSGMGVIFTSGTINYDNQNLYLSKPIFENQKTYANLSKNATPNAADPYYIFNFGAGGFTNTQLQNELTYHTTKVTKTNEGSDTEYPYLIGNSITIADTSYPDTVALDFYLDDANISTNPPLIGWYCLSDSLAASNKGIYSTSPNDTKNNYYLFNRGNVYYSGIQFKKTFDSSCIDEIKLFINTIVATYRSTGRVVVTSPKIQLLTPTTTDGSIEFTKIDIGTKTEIPFTFEITDGPPNMSLAIKWDDLTSTTDDPTVTKNNWNKSIYLVNADGSKTLVSDLTNITNGKYIVNIPVNDLQGDHNLIITAGYGTGKEKSLTTEVTYKPDPPTVTIDNDDLVRIVHTIDNVEQYLYIDIDYATISDESNYLKDSYYKLEFSIGNIADDATVSISITDASGNAIPVNNSKVYKDTVTNYNLNSVPKGSYYVDIPASIMEGISKQDIVITAAVNSSLKGSTTVTLRRRSLFPLD